jgi:hypothetical protein
MRSIPADQFMNLGNKTRVAQTIAQAVRLLIDRQLFTPAFCLIAAGIDGIAGGDRDKYIATLEEHFPDLCQALGAEVFYSKYRNGMIHEYSPKKGFGLTEDKEVGTTIVETLKIEGQHDQLICVNVEALARDFENYVHRILSEESATQIEDN